MQRNRRNNRMGKTRDLFKKIRATKVTFHAKMGSIKDRNGMDLKEAEDIKKRWQEYTDQIRSVAQSCPTLWDPMNRSRPGLPVHHQLPEFMQTYVHWVSDAIQPSHPLSSPSPPAFNLSQHHGLFKWISSSHQVAKVWSFSFSISPSSEYSGLFPLGWNGWISTGD